MFRPRAGQGQPASSTAVVEPSQAAVRTRRNFAMFAPACVGDALKESALRGALLTDCLNFGPTQLILYGHDHADRTP